ETKVEAKPAVDLSGKTVVELRALCKVNGISGYSKLKKAELIAELQK
ncbi:MAG: Rho termination factor N-terminal domain-containing protein, partial [Tenericutes bacterium]|nr:Rho termination factor N-terminal domain-containing protein [Mycoplasmatota bacterium]